MQNYKKVIIEELQDSFFNKKILNEINKKSGFLYSQKIEENNVKVYRPFKVVISQKLQDEIIKFLDKNLKVVFPKINDFEKKEILENNIFRIDGILDEDNNFNIVEINSHFPRLYMLNLCSLKKYLLKEEFEKKIIALKNMFLKNGKYHKINIVYDKNIHAIDDNLKCFVSVFSDYIENIFELGDFENNFGEIKESLEKNPNIYRMVIKTQKFEEIIKKLDIENLRIINSLEVGKIGEKANLSKINIDILPKSEKISLKSLKENFKKYNNKVIKTSSGAEGKGVFLPGEKINFANFKEDETFLIQDFIKMSKKGLQNGEKKYNDLNFLIVNGKILTAIIRLSNDKIVNVSAGGSFASCILEIK